MSTMMQRRKWVPDPAVIADELMEDYRNAGTEEEGNLDAMSTMASWQAKAQDNGDEFTEDDWLALVQELARSCEESEP